MARIENMFEILTLDYGLLNEKHEHIQESRMLVYTEDEARRQVMELIERALFEPMEYSRTVIEDGRGVMYRSIDPREDGRCYRVWYQEREVVFTD